MLRMGKNGFLRYGIFLLPMFLFFWFFFSSGFPFIEFAEDVPIPLVGGLVAMLAMHYFFYQWLKAPTLAGRRLLDQIEGFKHYLQVAEDDEIACAGAPDFSTEIYETWLPYAIALDLENEWTAKLNRAVAAGRSMVPTHAQAGITRRVTPAGIFRAHWPVRLIRLSPLRR